MAADRRIPAWAWGAYYAFLVAYIGCVLFVDGLALGPGGGRAVQYALGGATLGVLLAALRLSPPTERRETWFCVAYSTLIEVVATQAWHLYGYRLGNVPFYVPPGHGLIFAVSLQASRSAWLERNGRGVALSGIVVATAWAAWGLFGGARPDVHGALYWPFFVAFLWRSRKAVVWTITFGITSFIEVVGVRFGTWHWAPVMPGLGIPSGDPPSLIAGGYCSFALVATWLAAITLPRARERAREGAAVQVQET